MRETEREQTENLSESGHTLVIEGRNAVIEAFRSGRTIDKVFVLDGCQDGPVRTIVREAKRDRTPSGRDRLGGGLFLCGSV